MSLSLFVKRIQFVDVANADPNRMSNEKSYNATSMSQGSFAMFEEAATKVSQENFNRAARFRFKGY